MTIRTYGILASVIGSALGAWWWNRNRIARQGELTPGREPGTLIYDNTPRASETAPGVV